MRLPVIRFGSDEREVLAARAWGMLRDEGYFYLEGTEVSQMPFNQVRTAANNFFSLSLSEKWKHYIGKSALHRGYVPTGEEGEEVGSEPDLKEGFDSGLENFGVGFGNNVTVQGDIGWPELVGFRESVHAYQESMLTVSRGVAALLSVAIGMPSDYLNARSISPPNQLRLLHYPPSLTRSQGVGSHTDFECFTLLASTGPGLEVRGRDGSWRVVEPREESLVVTVGDLIEILTNGALRASEHRVGWITETRFSFPYFFSLDARETASPLPRFVHNGVKHYPPINVGEHLLKRTTEVFKYLRTKNDDDTGRTESS